MKSKFKSNYAEAEWAMATFNDITRRKNLKH